jgi:hypothetical protein
MTQILMRVVIRRTYTELGMTTYLRKKEQNYEDTTILAFNTSVDAERERRAYVENSTSDYWKERYTDTVHSIEVVDVDEYLAMTERASQLHPDICCDLAILGNCVCSWQSVCPEHGVRCHGSHD